VTRPPLAAQPIEVLKGVGPETAKSLRRLGVNVVGDLLEYFPNRYELQLSERPIAELVEGAINTARGEVTAVDYIPYPRKRFEITLADDSGSLGAVWFNGAYLRTKIHPGMTLALTGKVTTFRHLPQMSNPKWKIIEVDDLPAQGKSIFKPVYPASADVASDRIARLIGEHIEDLLAGVEEWFEPAFIKQRNLLPRQQAYRWMHTPSSDREATAARRRLVYDELMLMQLGLAIGRRLRDGRMSAPILRLDKTLDERIQGRFPFKMTETQLRAVYDISRDLQSGRPMNRLLQGDVGSGKTIVALHAMLTAVANKMQAVLLAPTEVLADQHAITISRMLTESKLRIERVTGRTKRGAGKSPLLAALANGDVHIAVGTQALIQGDIEFANLGLIVIDEQHKLGVQQRKTLRTKGVSPHYLVMTATPIPRTLALSYFADFDVTTLDSLPPGRQPIKTKWLRSNLAKDGYGFVRKQVQQGRQAYVVVPQIDDSDTDVASIEKTFESLKNGHLAGLRLAMLHGRMPADERDQVMLQFRAGEIDVLVATLVIEVGIDVPNATTIVIESAERFGLSQLHQLRGRVGRGSFESHCLLLSDATTPDATARMEAMIQHSSGFDISQMDLELRGPGQFFGTAQHGLPEMKLADISQEMELLAVAKDDALALLADDPELQKPGHRALRAALLAKFGEGIGLSVVG